MSDSEEDEELIKEAIWQNQREKYGADTKEGIQQCIECHDLRKIYREPFTKCDNSNCTRYVCDTCHLTNRENSVIIVTNVENVPQRKSY